VPQKKKKKRETFTYDSADQSLCVQQGALDHAINKLHVTRKELRAIGKDFGEYAKRVRWSSEGWGLEGRRGTQHQRGISIPRCRNARDRRVCFLHIIPPGMFDLSSSPLLSSIPSRVHTVPRD
jgi:hypothetical protein